MWSFLGQTQSDNINRIITITGDFYLLIIGNELKCDYNKRLITLNMITLSGFHWMSKIVQIEPNYKRTKIDKKKSDKT